MNETCPFCRADVPAGLLGYHYAGYRMPVCREVEGALGRWIPKAELGAARGALPAGTYAKAKAHKTCSTKDCAEPIWKGGRCWQHEHDLMLTWRQGKKKRPAELFRARKMTHATTEA